IGMPGFSQASLSPGQIATSGTIERQVRLNDFVDVRAAADVIEIKRLQPTTDQPEARELEFESLGTFVDVRPFQNQFVISGGIYSGDRSRIDNPTAYRPRNGKSIYTPEAPGTLKMAVKGEDVAPFLGLGFDTTADAQRGWGMKAMAGALFSGSPQVAMTSRNGPQSADSIVRMQLERELLSTDELVEEKMVHPVVQLGLTYRF
ncbi:MAG: hypothetical protein WA989_12985, partial [Henriciella sp.]|uniref:hypothetical protein n=1 Tax=Henriciella sp. TaxID=1968823 RepID=UPI003C75E775